MKTIKNYKTYRKYAVLPERYFPQSENYGARVNTYCVYDTETKKIVLDDMPENEAHKAAAQLDSAYQC